MSGIFRSLSSYNYRIYFCGTLLSNIGTWLQRTAQDWLVLTELTHHNATAVGLMMACQFGPILFLFPLTGFTADYFDRRRFLMVTQAIMAVLSLLLGLLTVTGLIELWHVYIFSFLFGCVTAFDAPARHTFVVELVGEKHLANAVGLNSTSFNAARMIGPAVAGVLIIATSTGVAFLINSASFVAILCSLAFLRTAELHPRTRVKRTQSRLIDGFGYAWKRPDLKLIIVTLFLIGGFVMNFPIFISTMTVSVFHADATLYGLLSSMMALGTIIGALLAARRERPGIPLLLTGSISLGLVALLASIAPNYWMFGIVLPFIGVSALTFMNSSNSLMQLTTEPTMRGRVMALRIAVARGSTLIGAPIVGWVADRFGPRWALGVGAIAGFVTSIIILFYLTKYRGLKLCFGSGRFGISYHIDPELPFSPDKKNSESSPGFS